MGTDYPLPLAPEVGAAAVASLVGVLELDTYSSSEADPSESSLPPVSVAPMRSRVASRSSSSTTSTPGIRTAPIPSVPSVIFAPSTDIISLVDAPPGIRRRRAILIQSEQDIPIGRLYCTHPGGPCRALTVRKSVRPLPSHHHSSSGHSTLDHSSSGHSTSGHCSSRHTPPVTTIVDSSTPSRFVYPPLDRTLRYSEAYRRWRSAPLSIMYPPMTSESSAEDSSSESSARPSRKRCRSPTTTVTLSIPAPGALVPSHVDLLPPRNRFRDFISPEDIVEDNIDADVLADIEADGTTVVAAAGMDIKAGVDAGIDMEVDVGVDIEDEVEGKVESIQRYYGGWSGCGCRD
ncbi:hypothetical protein Tco_0411117 [Tanacetum coccineum]